jgi:hypothetical protein
MNEKVMTTNNTDQPLTQADLEYRLTVQHELLQSMVLSELSLADLLAWHQALATNMLALITLVGKLPETIITEIVNDTKEVLPEETPQWLKPKLRHDPNNGG